MQIYFWILFINYFNLIIGNKLEKALREIGREDVIERCVRDVEVVTDDVEKAVANITLDQSGVDNLNSEIGKDFSYNDTFHQQQVLLPFNFNW